MSTRQKILRVRAMRAGSILSDQHDPPGVAQLSTGLPAATCGLPAVMASASTMATRLDSPAKTDSQELTFHWLYQRVQGLAEHSIYPKAGQGNTVVCRTENARPLTH